MDDIVKELILTQATVLEVSAEVTVISTVYTRKKWTLFSSWALSFH